MTEFVKRVRYFTNEFLVADDFTAEQTYHLDMRRRHNAGLHTAGVAQGLEVKPGRARTVTVTAGTAVDAKGRDIVVLHDLERDLSAHGAGTDVYLVLAYREPDEPTDQDALSHGHKRFEERWVLDVLGGGPPAAGAIVLARVHIGAQGDIAATDIHDDDRLWAGVRTDPFGELQASGLTLAHRQVPRESWPRLGFGDANRVDVTGSLRVSADATVAGGLTAGALPSPSGQVALTVMGDELRLRADGHTRARVSFYSEHGDLSYAVHVAPPWRWQFLDGSNTEYFGVDYPSGAGTFKGSVAAAGLTITGAGTFAGPVTAPALTITGAVGIATDDPKVSLQVGREGHHDSPAIRIGWGESDSQEKLTIYHGPDYSMGLRRGWQDLQIFTRAAANDASIHLMPSNRPVMSLLREGFVGIGTEHPKGAEGPPIASPELRIGWGTSNNQNKVTIYHDDAYKMGLRRGSRDLQVFAQSPDGDAAVNLMTNDQVGMSVRPHGTFWGPRGAASILTDGTIQTPNVSIFPDGAIRSSMWRVCGTWIVSTRSPNQPVFFGEFESGGGVLIAFASGSGAAERWVKFRFAIDGAPRVNLSGAVAYPNIRAPFASCVAVPGVRAGRHSVELQPVETQVDTLDIFNLTLLEFPF